MTGRTAFFKQVKRATIGLALMLVLGLLVGQPAHAATITVTVFIDDNTVNGNCTLREAVIAANTDTAVDGCTAGSGADTIVLAAGTYLLSELIDLEVSSNIIIEGAGRTATIITIQNAEHRAFNVTGTGSLTLNNLTIQGGTLTAGDGAAIAVGAASSLLVESVNFTNFQAVNGGAISNSGVAQLNRVNISQSSASGNGGGIANQSGGTLLITRSTIQGANGALGGAMYNAGSLSVVNATLGNNNASVSGGGIFTDGSSLLLANATIARNINGGVGIINAAAATLIIRNTILAGNSASDCVQVGGPIGTVTNGGFNLYGNTAGCFAPDINDVALPGGGIDAVLAPTLQANSGDTPTFALVATSPAVDGGNPAGCTDQNAAALLLDQRGVPRPFGAGCDIGAFELRFFNLGVNINSIGGATATIFSSPGSIVCGATCSESFAETTVVTLTINLGPGSSLTGVGGNPDCGDSVVTMDSDITCIFNIAQATPIPPATVGPTGTPTLIPTPTASNTPTPITPEPTATPLGRLEVNAAGGSFTCEGWTLTIAPNTVPNGSVLHCAPWSLNAAARTTGGFASLGRLVNIQLYNAAGEQLTNFEPIIRICNVYTDADVASAGGNARNFVIQRALVSGGWTFLPTQIDFDAKRLCTETNQLSLFDMIVRVPGSLPVTGSQPNNLPWGLGLAGLTLLLAWQSWRRLH